MYPSLKEGGWSAAPAVSSITCQFVSNRWKCISLEGIREESPNHKVRREQNHSAAETIPLSR